VYVGGMCSKCIFSIRNTPRINASIFSHSRFWLVLKENQA
jgi:hypothetical protein